MASKVFIDIVKLRNLKGVFEYLRDPARFGEVRVHSELGTLYWANGADLDPEVLYSHITGKPIDIETPAGA